MCDNRHSSEMSSIDETHQLIDAAPIKQEPDIKEEPHPVGDLIEAPLSDDHGDGQSLVDHNQIRNEDVPTNSSIDAVKIEVKIEPGENNKKDPKLNDSNANNNDVHCNVAINNRRNHLPRPNQFNRNDKSARNPKMPTKTDTRAKAPLQHQCEQCEYSTKRMHDLKRHLLKHTGEKPFPCDRCSKAFTSKRSLQNHLEVHAEEFPFHCAVCLMGFDNNKKKTEHQNDCHTIRYECHLCNKSFGSFNVKLIRHMIVHSGSKPFQCDECSKQFTLESVLKKHMTLHVGPRSFRCSNCRDTFFDEREMIAHQLKCNRRVYDCYVCGKSFGMRKENLDQHMCTHTGIKPFKCNQCPKKFIWKSGLYKHIRSHSRSLPWKCVICRQGFSMQTQQKAHQRGCRRRGYECYRCKKFYGSRYSNLKRHLTRHPGEKLFRCEICSNRYTGKSHLARHIKSIHNKAH